MLNKQSIPKLWTVNVDDLDDGFVEALKRDHAHADVEIRVQDSPGSTPSFSESDFWDAITRLDWSQEDDDAKIVEPLVNHLATQPISHIYRFSDMLAEKLWQLDTRAHAQVFLNDPESEGYLSVDDFLYARCAVVANGKGFYEKILHDPSQMPVDLTFEPLLYIAPAAYQRQTGNPFLAPGAFSYETYSNKEGWAK